MQVDAAKMRKLRNSIIAIDKDLNEMQKKGPNVRAEETGVFM